MKTKYKLVNWDGLIENKTNRINELCWKLFRDNEDGKELLDLLVEKYILKMPVASKEMKERYGDHSVGFRQGQNDMIMELNDCCNIFIKTKEPKK